MSFFNGDTSVSEQIIGSFQTVNITATTGIPTSITITPNILITLANGDAVINNGDNLGVLGSGTTNGYICRLFVVPNSDGSFKLNSDNIKHTSYEFTLDGGKFYTFIWNPDGTSNNWYYQG